MSSEEFISAFFGDGNDLGQEDVTANPNLERLVSDVGSPAGVPVVLPRRNADVVTWYVIPHIQAQARRHRPRGPGRSSARVRPNGARRNA